MTMEQVVTANSSGWSPEGTPTRDLSNDFSVMLFGIEDLKDTELSKICVLISVLTPSRLKAFDWEAAERRADWEESHSRFSEFNNVKDLLLDLHT